MLPELDLLRAYIIILPSIFFAGLVDAIAGGGGLISVPAYLAAGLPPHFALGNNKFSSVLGTCTTTIHYFKEGLIDVKIALLSAFFALIGSFMGTRVVLLLDPHFLNYILIFLIPIMTVFSFKNKEMGKTNNVHEITTFKKIVLAILAGLFIGFWDGFFGPGTGAFLILIFTILMKYDFVTANANAKVINLASNFAAVATFLFHGKVVFIIGIPAVIFGVAGNWVGSKLVIKRGSKIIRPLFLLVLSGLFIKICIDILS